MATTGMKSTPKTKTNSTPDVNASGLYKKLSHREHVLQLPDTYVGSVETHEEWRWVLDSTSGKMVHRKLQFNPGFYKIFDELVVNARDALVRSRSEAGRTPIKLIEVDIKAVDGDKIMIQISNDGDGIPIELHPEEKVYVPELIFGHLLTSGNYNKEEEKIVGGKNGYGSKCLDLMTKIPMFNDATMSFAKDIKNGDVLIGDDGTPRNVLDVFRGNGKLYEVSQAHAETYVVNHQHTLTLCMPDHKVILWSDTEKAWKILWWNMDEKRIQQKKVSVESTPPSYTCAECEMRLSSSEKRHYTRKHPGIPLPTKERKLPTFQPTQWSEAVKDARKELEEFAKGIPNESVFDIDIQDFMILNETTKKRLSGVRGKCVQWPSQDVSLDPYILGLWLGDGMSTGYAFACYGEKDPEIVEALNTWADNNDARINHSEKYVYRVVGNSKFGKKGCAPLKQLLAKYKLINNKHIPKEYLVNNRQSRLALLAGIIDTDGTVSRNGTRISITQSTIHTKLAHDIVFLARSLGFAVSIHKVPTKWTVNGETRHGEAFIINISGEGVQDIPTRLPRKCCAPPVARTTETTTGFLTIKELPEGEYVGIKIDGNERFLINDFTTTHNCTNIFSSSFTIDVQTPKNSKRYHQTWTDNMSVASKPSITATKATSGFVTVSYVPDLARFPGLVLEDMIAVLRTRTVELAALAGKEVKVKLNGDTVLTNTFEKFVKLFVDGGSIVYESCGSRWEVAAVLTRSLHEDDVSADESGRAISFVNGINTMKGGKHVDTVVRSVLSDFCEAAAKKKVPVKPGQIRDAVVFFVNATIVNPSFDSQTKDTLTTPATKFGSVFKSEKLSDGLMKIGLLEDAQAALDAKQVKDAKKTDGSKKKTLRGFPKLEDALWAGAARSSECTLILTEGDSAATSAITGLNVVGRERFGVFPLRGKLLNVKDISQEKFNKNEELTAIKAIIGLRQGTKYKSTKDLRYGRIMIMADQDHDGSHIKGLVMNLFHTEWPELMGMGFLCSLATPLLKASRRGEVISFYSDGEYQRWLAAQGGSSAGWTTKYYKGLGTSTKQEAKEWFERLAEIHYDWNEDSDNAMSLAFNKKRSDDRKEWLAGYDSKRVLDIGAGGHIPFSKFVDEELIHFSNADNIRSLPHIMDGLKPSQRKILFGCFKRGLRSEVKVAQLAGYVSEHAAYHHGEASLCGTIVGMAQNFVGANNVNLLMPSGQFGSRLMGGKDSASPRYIFTYLEPITDKIFRKEDAGILQHLEEEGMTIEPDTYLPTMPLILLNGCVGIGTGFSTDIPPYNPADIVRVLRERLSGRLSNLTMVMLKPWWSGFKGEVTQADTNTYVTKGIAKFDDEKNTITVTELPVGVWTKDYKVFLDEVASVAPIKDGEKVLKSMEHAYTDDGKPVLKGFDDLYTDEEVKFILYFDEDTYEDMKAHPADFEKRFRLSSSWKTSNMVAFNAQMKIEKFGTVGQILEAFYQPRLAAYENRRANEIKRMESDAVRADATARFLRGVLEGSLELRRAADEEIVAAMKAHSLPALSGSADSVDGYEYLLRLRMDRVKAKAIHEAEEAVKMALSTVEELKGTTARQLWLNDLEDFETAWGKMCVTRVEASAMSPRRAVVKKGVRK